MANANSNSDSKAGKEGRKSNAITEQGFQEADTAIGIRIAEVSDAEQAKPLYQTLMKLPDEQRAILAKLADRLAHEASNPHPRKTPEVPTMHVIPAWLDDKLCRGSPMMQGGSIVDILTQMHAMLELLSDAVMAPDGVSAQGAWLTIRTIQDAIDRLIHHANKNPLYMPKPEKRMAASHV